MPNIISNFSMVILHLFFISNLCAINMGIVKRKIPSDFVSPRAGTSALVITGGNSTAAVINFKVKNSAVLFSLGLVDDNFVLMSTSEKYIEAEKDKKLTLKGKSVTMKSLEVQGPVKSNKIDQWRMIHQDTFNSDQFDWGWSQKETAECFNYKILGGKCFSGKELGKVFSELPQHSTIRVRALFHFIGKWNSHTGYLKFRPYPENDKDDKYVWAQRCKNGNSPFGNMKMCPFEVCKVASPVDITLNHSEKSFEIKFGATLKENHCESGFGISNIEIYIK